MKGSEFKARQLWLPFIDAVGIALQIMSEVKEQAADWFKGWVKNFRSARAAVKPVQIELVFASSFSNHWLQWTPGKNKSLFE
jgi:acyl carrier protein phosphodiesterase